MFVEYNFFLIIESVTTDLRYRRRFCNRYLSNLRSHPEASKMRGGAKNPKGSSYKTFSSIKFSSIFLSISFWPFLPSFQFCLLYFLIVIKATTESPETPQWETSRGTRTTPKGTWKYTTENWAGLYCYGMTLSNEQGGSEKIFMNIRCPPITPGNFSKCFLFCGTTLV
jgi:hypothetical protein